MVVVGRCDDVSQRGSRHHLLRVLLDPFYRGVQSMAQGQGFQLNSLSMYNLPQMSLHVPTPSHLHIPLILSSYVSYSFRFPYFLEFTFRYFNYSNHEIQMCCSIT